MTLCEAVSAMIRRLHDSPRTEEAYLRWVREVIRFHHRRHPREMGAAEVTAFLNGPAVRRHTSASTPNQALCTLVFLDRTVLELEMPTLEGLEPAQRPTHLPNVLSRRDVLALLDRFRPPLCLLGDLLYGAGLRLPEALALHAKDVDLERHQITLRRGKGAHDRVTLLPVLARDGLAAQIETARRRHLAEFAAGRGEVEPPYALRAKIRGAATSLACPFLFPASRPARTLRPGARCATTCTRPRCRRPFAMQPQPPDSTGARPATRSATASRRTSSTAARWASWTPSTADAHCTKLVLAVSPIFRSVRYAQSSPCVNALVEAGRVASSVRPIASEAISLFKHMNFHTDYYAQ